MDTAPRDFCQGSCDPVDCMPIEKRILSIFLSVSERIGLRWTDKEDTDVVPFALFFFFFLWRGKIFIFKLRFFFVHSLNQYALCYQVTFFSFLFTQYPKQMLTHLTMLKCTTSWRERGSKKKKKLNDACFFSECQMWDYWTNIHCRKLIPG